jgi:hypothetical protein
VNFVNVSSVSLNEYGMIEIRDIELLEFVVAGASAQTLISVNQGACNNTGECSGSRNNGACSGNGSNMPECKPI